MFEAAWRNLMLGIRFGLTLASRPRRPGRGATTAQRIRTEALRANDDPIGRPLPLLGCFYVGAPGPGTYMTPANQVSLIEAGHYWLPIFDWAHTTFGGSAGADPAADAAALAQVRAWGLPLALVSTQWERVFYDISSFASRPITSSGRVFDLAGDPVTQVDPLGPNVAWEDLATEWLSNSNIGDLQAAYPNPPLVLCLSNNEAARAYWENANDSKRFVDAHGTETTGNFKVRTYGDGLVARFNTFFSAVRDGFPAGWANAKFIGYNVSQVPFMGRWWGWQTYSYSSADPLRLDPMAAAWDGNFGEYYLNYWNPITDFNVWGMQVEVQNNVPFLTEAYAVNPAYWHEVIVWDGFQNSTDPAVNKRAWYESIGQSFTPARYEGMVQFAMWLTRPRVVREFRYVNSRETIGFGYLDAVMAAVGRVHDNATLRRFWRNGALVENAAEEHPYQDSLLPGTDALQRWFLLTADVNPARPWALSTELLVFALARVLGEAPSREWLVYAHSPRQDRTGVEVTVPGYGPVTIDAAQRGSWWLVNEAMSTVTEVV